jgi:capsular exopolysaccharide synthesis family protein
MPDTNLPEDFHSHSAPGGTVDMGEPKAFSIDYRRLWEATKKNFWLIVLYLIAGVVAAVVYLSNATPIYRSVARVKVEQRIQSPTPSMTGLSMDDDLRGLEMLQTIQLGFVSRSLMQRMIDRLKLKTRGDFTRSTGLEGTVEDEEFTNYLLTNTRAELIQGTRLLTISFDHPDPHVAQEMVDSLVREFVALEGEQRLKAAAVNLNYLIDEKKSLEQKLGQSRKELIAYTRAQNTISISNETNIVASQMLELNTRLGASRAERIKLETDNSLVEKYRDDPVALLEIPSIAQLPEIGNLRTQLNTLDAELSKARQKYLAKSPALEQMESQRASLQKALEAEALRAPQMVERAYRSALQTEQALQRATDEQEKKAIDTKALSIESDKLQGEIDADNLSYQATLRKLNEEMAQARSQAVFIQVVDPASPAFKVQPKPLLVLAIAIFLSLLVSAVTVVILSSLDTSFKSVDELEAVMGLQVLSAVPLYETKAAKKKKGSRAPEELDTVKTDLPITVPLLEDPYSVASEAYRTLRASLLLLEDESHSILVTSAVPDEGKSTTSLSLAISMAQRGARTLLIEADLRKPVLENRMFGRYGHFGMADFLSDRSAFDDLVQPTAIPNLSVITAGKVTKSTGELLLRRHKVEKFFELARQNFDQVIVDSAPLLAVSDTLTIARHFKVITMVVRSHKTPRRLVRRALDLLKRLKRQPSGVVLSMVPPGNAYYYYGYNDGGRAYGADHQTAAAS